MNTTPATVAPKGPALTIGPFDASARGPGRSLTTDVGLGVLASGLAAGLGVAALAGLSRRRVKTKR